MQGIYRITYRVRWQRLGWWDLESLTVSAKHGEDAIAKAKRSATKPFEDEERNRTYKCTGFEVKSVEFVTDVGLL